MKVDLYKRKRTYTNKDGKKGECTDLVLALPINGSTLYVRIKPAFEKDKSAWSLLYGCAESQQ